MALSWDEMFERAKEYYEQNGHLVIPLPYVCPDGTRLGAWINTQRAVNNGIRPGIMDDHRRALLDSIGMDWNPNLTAWNNGFDELIKYKQEYGNIEVPLRYVSDSGFKLGLWLQNQRRSYLNKGRGALDESQIERLESIGVIWDPHANQWESNYSFLQKYYQEHGNIDLPNNYYVNGVNLERWLDTQRQTYNGFGNGVITEYQIKKLEKLNVFWGNKIDAHWDEMFLLADAYAKKYGHLSMLQSYRTEDGKPLGSWIFDQRRMKREGELSLERESKLTSIGMIWNYKSQQSTSFFEQATFYYVSQVFPEAVSRDKSLGFELDIFIPSINCAIEYDGEVFHSAKKIKSDEKKNQECANKGVRLYRIREANCAPMYDESFNFYLPNNSIDDFEKALRSILNALGEVAVDIDINRDSGKIFSQFLMIGPPLNQEESPANYLISKEWYERYSLAQDYYKEYGNLLIANNKTYRGEALGLWVSNQRHYYNSKTYILPTQKIILLEKIGMIWNVNTYHWEQGFYYAKQYYEMFGNLDVSVDCVFDGYNLGKWIRNQRSKYKGKYKKAGTLTEKQISRLNAIGMIWFKGRW